MGVILGFMCIILVVGVYRLTDIGDELAEIRRIEEERNDRLNKSTVGHKNP